MNHTIERHRRLYGLLRDTGTKRYRHDLVYSYSNGRTENSAELTDMEVNELIKYLEQMSPVAASPRKTGQKMRRRIFSLCYNIGWTEWDDQRQGHKVDTIKLDRWMIKYSYLHKPLNSYKPSELQVLVKQFEKMALQILSGK